MPGGAWYEELLGQNLKMTAFLDMDNLWYWCFSMAEFLSQTLGFQTPYEQVIRPQISPEESGLRGSKHIVARYDWWIWDVTW